MRSKLHCLCISYLKFIRSARLKGYEIILFFVWLESVELAKSRVASRVGKGGHNIPRDMSLKDDMKRE